MLENLLIVMLVLGVLSVVSGLAVFMLLRYLRRQDERLKLIMKTLYLNTKGIKTVGDKTDMIFVEQQNGFDSQRKSFDHQRVLVSSLNRQLKHIEAALFNGGNLDPTGGDRVNSHFPQAPLEVTGDNLNLLPSSGANVPQNNEMSSKDTVRRKGVTLLKSLLQEKRMQTSKAPETRQPETRRPETRRPEKLLQSSEASEAMQKADKLTAIFEKNFQIKDESRRVANG